MAKYIYSLETPSLFFIHERLGAKSAPAQCCSGVHLVGRGPGPGADVAEPVPVHGLPLPPPRNQGPPLLGVQHKLEHNRQLSVQGKGIQACPIVQCTLGQAHMPRGI